METTTKQETTKEIKFCKVCDTDRQHTHTAREELRGGQHEEPNKFINNIVMLRAMRKNGIGKYGFVSKKKKVLGCGLCSLSFIIPDLCFGLVLGCVVLGKPIKLLIKDKLLYYKELLLLW